LDPRAYQDLETVSEQALALKNTVITVGPGEYANSGFTKATMPAATYLPAQSLQERFKVAAKELAKPGVLLYLYIPELDQLAHRFGTESRKWLETIEELDSELVSFVKALPSGAGALLTADHGVIDVDHSRHVYLDELKGFQDLVMIGGDPRCGYLYFETVTDLVAKRAELSSELAGLADVTTIQELIETGWLHTLSETAKTLAPDLIVLPKGDRVIYHRGFAKQKSLEMVGQHGGMSKAEWEVPLLVF
jgi:hypothetical protein